jgi:amidase/6-aminohexanoate-cyclic-dimer hydrolase
VHLAAAFGEDETLIALCHELELARPWFHKRPPLLDIPARPDAA